jgi:hypothetical protein
MWTLVTSLNLRHARRRFGRVVLGAAMLIGTGSQLLALLPAVSMAGPTEEAAATPGDTAAAVRAPVVPAVE